MPITCRFWRTPSTLETLFMLILIVLLCIAGAGAAFAQQNVSFAALSGRAQDANKAAIAGASVEVQNRDTNQSMAATTDQDGRFRFSLLPVGRYRLKLVRSGFNPFESEVTLTVGQALELPLTLAVAGVAADVNVSSDLPVIEAAKTQVSETIVPKEIDDLPLNGRNYLDLALLVPGVSRTNTGSNQRFAETSAVPSTGISIAGQRNLYNGFVVDGLSANDDAADLSGTFFSQEVIREFQVVTSGGISEFGRASAGVINIITKSGTNDWAGRVYGFFRNQRFDARNPLALRKDPLTQGQYGASIGGPVARDRTFLFANFEQTRRNDSTVITIPTSTIASVNGWLDQVNFNGPRLETGVVPSGYDSTNFFARIDHKINNSNQFAAHYSLYNITAGNSRTVGGLNTISRGTSLDNRDQTFYVSNLTTLSAKSINEARFQYTRSRLLAPVNDPTGPAVNISGVASFGTATFSPTARGIDLFELVDNVSTQNGNHSLKLGVDYLYNRVNILFPGARQGVYTFTSLNNFFTGAYGSFQQAFGAPSQFQSNPNLGLFIEDEWRPRTDLTINAGLRYDAQFLPDPIKTDTNNIAPRLGIAYSPGDHKTVLRASLGIYYDRIPLRATSNALQRDGSKYIVVQLSPAQSGAPVFPNILAAAPSVLLTRPNVTRIDPDIQNSYSEQASVQFERQLFKNASLSVGYIHLRGLHLILSRNLNVPRFPASAGVPNLGRPDPNFGNISRYESSGDSYYDGMLVSFNGRMSNWADVRVSYTLSKSIDDAGNFFFSSPQNNFDLRDDRGLSDNDQRHRLTVSGTLQAPWQVDRGFGRILDGFQLGYIFTYSSRLPFSIVTGNDRNFDTNFNDRPVGIGRNTGRGFDFASFDLRLSRRFKFTERVSLEALAEGFNLLNHANLQLPNNTFGMGTTPLASFDQATAASDPRQFQFGLRLNF